GTGRPVARRLRRVKVMVLSPELAGKVQYLPDSSEPKPGAQALRPSCLSIMKVVETDDDTTGSPMRSSLGWIDGSEGICTQADATTASTPRTLRSVVLPTGAS